MEYRRVVGKWWCEHDVIFIRSNPAFDRFETSKANWLMIKRYSVRYFASLLVRYENAVASHSLEFAAQNAMRYRLSTTLCQIFGSPLRTNEHGLNEMENRQKMWPYHQHKNYRSLREVVESAVHSSCNYLNCILSQRAFGRIQIAPSQWQMQKFHAVWTLKAFNFPNDKTVCFKMVMRWSTRHGYEEIVWMNTINKTHCDRVTKLTTCSVS